MTDSPAARGEPERRHINVMFCDLVGSTQLSERYDPEDLRELMLAYQNWATNIIKQYRGFVARYVGDGLLVFFGYPEAHEKDAERAVLAALDLVNTIEELTVNINGECVGDLQVRIGIATGLVVVGDVVGDGADVQQSTIFGKTPNLAARIQALAGPNTVMVEPRTHHIVKNRFECEDMGEHQLKGISAPIRVWRVVRLIELDTSFESINSEKEIPLVDREDELDIFLQYWERARKGSSRAILISGEAGIGKSRVVREFYTRISAQAIRYYRFQGSSYYSSSAFHPVIRYLEHAAGFEAHDDSDRKLAKLERFLGSLAGLTDSAVPLLASLMSIPARDQHLDMSPERQKESTLELLAELLASPRDSGPTLLVVEDTQWIDPSFEELLSRIIARLKRSKLLLVATSRGGFPARWTTHPGVLSLALDRLGHDDCTEIVGSLTGDNSLPESLVEKIVSRSDGVPLFVEELTKTMLSTDASSEAGGPQDDQTSRYVLPESLQDSLMARLDQLNIGKRVAQIGAVIGREFSYGLLAAAARLPEGELNLALSQLREAGVIHAVGAPPQANYSFNHALVRDAAYESLLKSRRRDLHARIAKSLEELFSRQAVAEPELIAQHYAEAGLFAKAIANWQMAGQRAMRRLAFAETVDHVKHGLACLGNIEDPVQRVRTELALRTLLGPALMASQGYGSSEVEAAYARARELCEQMPETPELFPVLFGLWGFHLVRAEYRIANELSVQLLKLAHAAQDDGLMVEAYGTAGVTLFYLGELTRARDHLEQGMVVYDPQAHAGHAFRYGQDPWVACSAFHGQTLWLLGFPDSGLQSTEAAVARAKELGHHFSVTFSQFLNCVVLQLRHEPDKLLAQAEAGLKLSQEQGFPHWVPRFRLYRAWALTASSRSEHGIAEMDCCLDKTQPLSLFVRRPYYLALLAEAKSNRGDTDESLRIMDEAFQELAVFEDRWAMPEIHRIKGELLLRSNGKPIDADQYNAEACFEQALELARDQGAFAWQLRTLLSLYRLHSSQGRPEVSRGKLESAVSGFNEGASLRDLTEARQALAMK